MKRLVCLLLTAALAGSLAACGAGESQASSVPESSAAVQSARESRVRIGVTEAPSACLAGTLVNRNSTDRILWTLLNDCSLFVTDPEGVLAENPSVLEQWSAQRREDGVLVCTLTLREGLRYSSGQPIRAGDFLLPLLFGAIAGREDQGYRMFLGGEDYAAGVSNCFSGLRIPDERTLELSMDPAYAQSFYALQALRLQPWNPEFWLGEGWSIGDLGQGACLISDGTAFRMEPQRMEEQIRISGSDLPNLDCAGPYRITEIAADRLILEKNPNFCGNFENYQPGIEVLELCTVDDPLRALREGQVDLVSRLTDPEQIRAAGELTGFDVQTFPRNACTMLRFNCAAGPSQFAEVRQALACFLDREALSRVIGGPDAVPVHGPYTPVMWQTRYSQRFLEQELNPYTPDPRTAEGYLVSGGWTKDSRGGEWSGSGLRYKEVTKQQAQGFSDCLTLSDGRILMPLILHVSVTGGDTADALQRALEADSIARSGMEILVSTMSFAQLQADFPSCSAALMTEEYLSAVYNHAFRYTRDPQLRELGYNPTGLVDGELDLLSTAMVYSPEPGDWESYLGLWQQYILRCNALLPELPLGTGTCAAVVPQWLQGYAETALWDLAHTILYCTVTD